MIINTSESKSYKCFYYENTGIPGNGETSTWTRNYLANSLVKRGSKSPGWPKAFTGSDYSLSKFKGAYQASRYRFDVRIANGLEQVAHLDDALPNCISRRTNYGSVGPVQVLTDSKVDMQRLKDIVTASVVEQANSPTYNIGEDMWELQATVDLLTGNLKALTKVIPIVKSKWDKFAKFAKSVGAPSKFPKRKWYKSAEQFQKAIDYFLDSWMAYRYGLCPLVYSSQDILDTAAQKAAADSKKEVVYSYRASRTAVGIYRAERFGRPGNLPASISGKMEIEQTTKVTARATIADKLLIQPGFYNNVLKYHTFRSATKLTWDITKLAWVADWFGTLGAKMASLSGTPSTVNTRVFTISVKTEVTTIDWVGAISITWRLSDRSGSQVYEALANPRTTTSYSREVTIGTPVVNTVWDIHLNSKRFVDAAALLRKAARR